MWLMLYRIPRSGPVWPTTDKADCSGHHETFANIVDILLHRCFDMFGVEQRSFCVAGALTDWRRRVDRDEEIT